MSLKKMVMALSCVAALSLGVAHAAGKIQVTGLPVGLPSIDINGALDPGNPGPAIAKLSLNLKTLAVAVSAKGNVQNIRARNTVITNMDALGIGGAITLITDKYTVSAKGKASYTGKFQVP